MRRAPASCSADLPFVSRSGVLKQAKEQRPQTAGSGGWISDDNPLGNGG